MWYNEDYLLVEVKYDIFVITDQLFFGWYLMDL